MTTMRLSLPLIALATVALIPACNRTKPATVTIQTVPVTRRDIIIDAQANGVVEPINIVEIKSKASGLVTRMNVETGSLIKPGDLLVQVDTRDVQNQYQQALADQRAAEAKLEVSRAQKARTDQLYQQRVITEQEHETAALDYANSQAAVVRARTNTDLAKQRLEDATVTATVGGTVIERTVSQGMVITGATGNSATGGTTLLKTADLTRVRMRAQFNETDIGQIRAGQPATVIVDAYADRRFSGVVEKIEPQAVVTQGVTMFPVLVTLDNADGALKPGMNGEVQVQIDARMSVLAVPNEAVKNVREAVALAPFLGLNPDSVQAILRGGARGRVGATGNTPGGPTIVATAPGEVALPPQQGAQRQGVQGRAGRNGGRGGGQRFQAVTDAECSMVKAALDKKPAESAKLTALRESMRGGSADGTAIRTQMTQLYATLGVDGRTANACAMRANGAQVAGRTDSGGAQLTIADTDTFDGRARPGLVFVAKGTSYEPRQVSLGASNFEFTEVINGLQEGEEVAMLNAVTLQMQRQAQTDRLRQNMPGGVPGMTQGGNIGGGRGRGR